MTSAPLSVLLLGWDEAPRAGGPPASFIRPLVHTLAAHVSLSVMLPRWPRPPFEVPAGTSVTALADLTEAEARAARPHPAQRPAQWQQPSAPYVGAADTPLVPAVPAPAWTAPAAPYVGAALTSTAGAAPNQAQPRLTQVATLPAPEAFVAPEDLADAAAVPASAHLTPEKAVLLNHDAFARDLGSPDAGEAAALDQPTTSLTRPEDPLPELPPAPQRATIPEALAALEADGTPAADLNYQVIQYARFATRRAQHEGFGVVYATDWPTWLAALEIRQQTGRPLVLHVHSLAQERATPADRGWALELERLALRRADLVLAASDAVAHLLRTRYQLADTRLQVVDPTDTDTIEATLQRLRNHSPKR